ncbi:flagellar hook protein FlgE [Sphingomonas sp. AP4-R1]|uniref:flagellar hook protein FlgE n=1 Tax=Sphingomonas sp. AP4-R1 TaxID=2735134 RepID=UPI0014937D0A|nr:flagellar hook protein FlgE [Sphingomonas sp. AP4-R1]QJU57427.1 flagellar hook protein FlgE [Sphingomonas sp. AP4-R1]
MSLYSALYAGVSGLSAQAAAMATVADNITNVNTVGYKGVAAEFSTLVTDGRLKSSYSAGGVNAAPQALISKQGLLQAAAQSTDIGIEGAGFFVVRTSADDDQVAYTRAGSFRPDANGYLKNAAGYYLQGWPVDANGNYVNNGDIGSLQSIKTNALTGTAAPTTAVTLRANLQSTQDPIAGPYVAGNMASGTVTPQFSRPITVYDAQGGAHQLTFGFVKTAANTWQAEIYAQPASDVTAAGGLLASGTVAFNPDGSLDLAGSSPALFANLTPGWTNGAGSSPISLAMGSQDGLDGLTQSGQPSALLNSSVNGGLLGTVASVEISDSGRVTAVFEDGTTRDIYQLPLATFQNPDGLTRLSGNAYVGSGLSGTVAINEPGTLGSGSISSNALEASNVDLAQEFSNMIRFQRAYSASSKIITTVDEMLQEVSNLKR